MRKILYAKPSITDLEIEYVENAVRNGWGTNCYDYLNMFVDLFKDYIKCNYLIPTSSCTGALHIALSAMGINTGDEVIVPDTTWIGSVAPIIYLNAKPVFVDIIEDTWCIDPKKIEEAITTKTKAIIPVHLYGNLAEMDEILEIAEKHNLYVIEDAAESLGSEYKGKLSGTIGDCGIYSFHGTKTMTTGEGGMLIFKNKELFEIANVIADQGRDPKVPKPFWIEKIGLKYKMSNLLAALGCAQIKRIEELISKKREIFFLYKSKLSQIEGLKLNPELDYWKNTFWMPTIIFSTNYNFHRDDILNYLASKGISGRPFFYPISMFPMFENKPQNTVSYSLYSRGINVPNYFEMTEEDVDYVYEQINSYIKTL